MIGTEQLMTEKAADLGLSFRVKDHALDLDDQEKAQYAILGYFISRLSSLEYHLDEFIFNFAESYPRTTFSFAKSYPVKYESKLDFLVDCIIQKPFLRECGDLDGLFNINLLAYGLEEIFDFRNILVHGKIILTERAGERIVFRVRKYGRVRSARGRFSVEEYRYSAAYVSYLLDQIGYHESTLMRLVDMLSGKNVVAEREALLRGRSASRAMNQSVLVEAVWTNLADGQE